MNQLIHNLYGNIPLNILIWKPPNRTVNNVFYKASLMIGPSRPLNLSIIGFNAVYSLSIYFQEMCAFSESNI